MSAVIRFENRVYKIAASMALVCDIEHELGAIPRLAMQFDEGNWRLTDLIVLTHMMLQAAGRTIDFMALGDQMLQEGVDPYLEAVRSFLFSLINNREAA